MEFAGESPDCAKAVEVLKHLTHASGSWARDDLKAVGRVCEIGKRILVTSAEELVRVAGGAPMLNSRSADGTPISTMARSSNTLPSGSKVKRSGRVSHEFLVKNQFLRAHLTGSCATCVLLQEPIPLLYGKSAHAIFQACLKDWRSLRQMGHSGVCIEHFVFDRFAISAHERLWRQWHQMTAPNFDHLAGDLPPELFRMTEFLLVTPCAAHDAQSAFRWAMSSWLGDRELLRDAYVGIEALRNSMDLLTGHLSEWIGLRLSFAPKATPEVLEQRRLLWQSLDVDFETVEVLTEILQLVFRDGRIWVAEDTSTRPDLVDLVSTACLSVWRFVKWSDSRFLTAGASARTMIAAFLTGLESLVQFIRDDESASKFYINGFTRLSGDRKVFLAQCAFVSRVGDGVLAELMEDNRVALSYQTLWQCMSEDMLWLATLPSFVWDAVAEVAETNADELRSSCIARGHVSYHFIWRRILRPAGELPWTLTRGDVRQNLLDLKAEAEPEEPVSRQIWSLLNAGFSLEQLQKVVEVMSDIGWTTLPAEQQHGSLAVLRRWHHEYSLETLCSRALLLQLGRLLPSMSREEKEMARLTRELQKVLGKSPEKAGGRQMYISEMFAHLRSRSWTHSRRELPEDMNKVIFRRHAAIWSKFSLESRRERERWARLRAAQAQRDLLEEADRIRAQRQMLADRIQTEEIGRKPIIMSECAMSQQALSTFGSLLAGDDYKPARVQPLREEAMRCPRPTPRWTQENMEAQSVWKAADPKMPPWSRTVSANREYFENTVFMVYKFPAEPAFWKFVYAVQSPCYLAVSRLTFKEEHMRPMVVTGQNWHSARQDKYRFHCNFADNASAMEMPEVEDHELFVIPGVTHNGGMEMSSPCSPVLFRQFVSNLPAKTVNETQPRRAKQASQHMENLLSAFPWLAGLDRKEGFASKDSLSKECEEPKEESTAEEVLLDDEELEMAMKSLDGIRAELASAAPEQSFDDFKTTVLGGAWLLKTKGIPFDAIQGAARGALAKEFCKRRVMQQSARFDVQAYGQEACGILARAWCHRMQYFFNMELADKDGEQKAFSRAQIAGYGEPTEFTKLTQSQPVTAALAKRIQQIRDLCSSS